MTRRLRVIAMVVFLLAVFSGTVSAYNEENNNTSEMSVIVNLDGVPRMVTTEEQTVDALLNSLNDISRSDYTLNIDGETPLSNNMVVNLASVKEKIVKKTVSLEYQTEKKENPSLEKGKEKVVQEGAAGTAEVVYKESYSGDELLDTEEVNRKVTKTAVNKVVEIGTAEPVKPKLTPAVMNIEPVNLNGVSYKKAMNVTATGYTPYDPGCNGITASGTKAQKGVIAVDPRVIPMGTKLYIPGYGKAVAEDTGGAIKGNKIDLCYATKSEAYNWGVRNVTVYILDE